MPRDIFGNIMRTDMFGRKVSKKQIKTEVLEENRKRGKMAEDNYRMGATLRVLKLKERHMGVILLSEKEIL